MGLTWHSTQFKETLRLNYVSVSFTRDSTGWNESAWFVPLSQETGRNGWMVTDWERRNRERWKAGEEEHQQKDWNTEGRRPRSSLPPQDSWADIRTDRAAASTPTLTQPPSRRKGLNKWYALGIRGTPESFIPLKKKRKISVSFSSPSKSGTSKTS